MGKHKTEVKDYSYLVARFAAAGLTAIVEKAPMRRTSWDQGATEIFQMDITRKIKGVRRDEIFRIWPGNDENCVEVVSIDPAIRQLILAVKERRRDFVMDVPVATIRHQQARHGANWIEHFLKEHNLRQKDVLRTANLDSYNPMMQVRRTTAGSTQHYLCGVDERQLFIARLPRGFGTTVADAHRSLKTATVTFAEGRAEGRTIRQGEWFLVNTTAEERRTINEGLRKKTLALVKDAPIQADATRFVGGKPHIADELVRVPAKTLSHGFTVQQRNDVFVRGKIRHPDHATVKVGEWRKVIRNAEQQNSGFDGIGWVD